MSFQEYVNQIFGWPVDLYDLSDEDLIMLEEEYEKAKTTKVKEEK